MCVVYRANSCVCVCVCAHVFVRVGDSTSCLLQSAESRNNCRPPYRSDPCTSNRNNNSRSTPVSSRQQRQERWIARCTAKLIRPPGSRSGACSARREFRQDVSGCVPFEYGASFGMRSHERTHIVPPFGNLV